MKLPQRRRPARKPVYDSNNRSNIVFLTVCTHQRKSILANSIVHSVLLNAWAAADHWIIGRYMIMPDHIHLFCSPACPDYLSVKTWLRFWKSEASKSWPDLSAHPIWQIDGWDRQLRKGESYSAKWNYVCNNPVRHGLTAKPEDWPYQGEMHPLQWHD